MVGQAAAGQRLALVGAQCGQRVGGGGGQRVGGGIGVGVGAGRGRVRSHPDGPAGDGSPDQAGHGDHGGGEQSSAPGAKGHGMVSSGEAGGAETAPTLALVPGPDMTIRLH